MRRYRAHYDVTVMYTCQYLRIREGNTVHFVDYVLGAPLLPPNALIGGYNADGVNEYIGLVLGTSKYGYYIPESNRFVAGKNVILGEIVGL